MILLADSGATKTKWALVDQSHIVNSWIGPGLHPLFIQENDILSALHELPINPKNHPQEIYFYGAGCSSPDRTYLLQKSLQDHFSGATIQIESDLVGACKALCGRQEGIAAILGTGSNSAVWNGKSIARQQISLGYLLGDEGSGADLGKRLVTKMLHQEIDQEIRDHFFEWFKTNPNELITQIYRHPFPNRYLASFAPFLIQEPYQEYFQPLVKSALHDFMGKYLRLYPEAEKLPIHFTGSVAGKNEQLIRELGTAWNLTIGQIQPDPMDGLILFHSKP